VTLKVNSFEPQFVQDLADSILDISGKLLRNLKTHQINAKRLFIEERLVEVSNEKNIIQERFRGFLEKNRGLDSPSLLMREKEMSRELELQTSLYMTLKTKYEEAKIEEVAKTPMIQIIDGPIKPGKMSSPKPVISVFLSLLISFSLTFILVYLREASNLD
jgi:capsule polysaccharide export protein KpsE/RkpR